MSRLPHLRTALLAAILILASCKAPPGDRALTLYGGRFIDNGLPDEILLGNEWNELASWIGVAALSKVIKHTPHADWEVEGQFGQHFGDQDHFEVNALVAYRWRTFPWNDWLRTSFAVGEGLSLASEVPALEEATHVDDGGSRRFLNYLLLEWTFGAPSGRGPDLVRFL